jgi:hypothetical protein
MGRKLSFSNGGAVLRNTTTRVFQAATLGEDTANYGDNDGLCWLAGDAIWVGEDMRLLCLLGFLCFWCSTILLPFGIVGRRSAATLLPMTSSSSFKTEQSLTKFELCLAWILHTLQNTGLCWASVCGCRYQLDGLCSRDEKYFEHGGK